MDTRTIEGWKKDSLLLFKRDGKKIAFDLKDLKFKRVLKSGATKDLKGGAAFFRNLSVSDVADGFREDAYAEMIRKVDGSVSRVKNFASVFAKVQKYAHIESYLLLGIQFSSADTFKKPASQFPKEVLEFMKESQINFSGNYWEYNFQRFPDLVTKLCTYVRRRHYLDLEVYRMLYSMVGGWNSNIEKFKLLSDPQTKEVSRETGYNYGRRLPHSIAETPYGCEYKSLFDYLVMIDRTEACDFSTAMTLYRDYLKMMREIERNKAIAKKRETNPNLDPLTVGYLNFNKVEKYPKYLRVRHDIVQENYNVWQDEVDEKIFAQMVNRGYEYSWGGYKMVVPKKADDIRNEGTNLHHCVASYVSRVMDGTTQIVFLRKTEEESLVTVEIRAGAIVQARGYNNRSVDAAEDRWLKTYAKIKNLNYKDVKRNPNMPTPPIMALAKYDPDVALLRELSQLVNG
jgi:protein-tyrosine-phosphatase